MSKRSYEIFGAIPFESLNISHAKTRKLRLLMETASISVEQTSKELLFFIVNDMRSFMKPECSITQNSAMTDPYK